MFKTVANLVSAILVNLSYESDCIFTRQECSKKNIVKRVCSQQFQVVNHENFDVIENVEREKQYYSATDNMFNKWKIIFSLAVKKEPK